MINVGTKKSSFIQRTLFDALSFLKESIFQDDYAKSKGFLQEKNPRFKVLAILALLLAGLSTKSVLFLCMLYLVCLILAALSSISIGFFLKRTWIFIPAFTFFIAIPSLFSIFTPGDAIAHIKILGIDLIVTRQGVLSAAIFFLRVLDSVSLCVLLTITTRHCALLRTLRVFKIPQVFVMTLGMCYRYIYLFIELLQNTYFAIKSRAQHITKTGKAQGVVAWNIANLWQRSYDLHEEIYNAMISRGYRGEVSIIEENKTNVNDWLLLALGAAIFLISLWQNRFLN